MAIIRTFKDVKSKLEDIQKHHNEVDLFPTLAQLFVHMGFSNVQITHGNNEFGRDLIFSASAVLRKGLCLYPTKSLVQNIGFDSEGTHTSNPNSYEAFIMADETTDDFPKIKIEDSKVMRKEWERLFKKLYPQSRISFKTKIKRKIKSLLERIAR